MAETDTVRILVDAARTSPLRRIWRFEGYDELNYTYTPRGRELLAKLGGLSDAPYFIRAHFLLCSGSGVGGPKWGSSNVYTEDAEGNSVYSWDIIDRVFDTYLETGCVPFVELGFMPEALSTAPASVTCGDPREGGWKYPPRDYGKWRELIRRLAEHCLARYGLRSVSRWYWELWNEPDIPFYWQGGVQEYSRLYDYTVAGLTEVLPQARVGGPGTTNPGREKAGAFLRAFLEHCVKGTNAVTGAIGTRLDFVSFHSKGGGFKKDPKEGKHTPSLDQLVDNVAVGLDITARFPGLAGREIVVTECDPDGGAASGKYDNPNLVFRNTEYYASYVAAAVCRLLDLERGGGSFRVDGMLTWAFEFEDREYFEGFRTLSTNGIDKPVLNVFRFLSNLGTRRLAVDLVSVPLSGGEHRGGHPAADDLPRLGALAAGGEDGSVQLFLVSHHDDWDLRTGVRAEITLSGLPEKRSYRLRRFQIDHRASNAHTLWREMGEPREISDAQIRELALAGRPSLAEQGTVSAGPEGTATLELNLPSHCVCLVVLSPRAGPYGRGGVAWM